VLKYERTANNEDGHFNAYEDLGQERSLRKRKIQTSLFPDSVGCQHWEVRMRSGYGELSR
jgi:hypothetical protein